VNALAELGARRAWLFDLDGTLVDTAPDLHAALQETLAAFGHPGTELALVRAFVGQGARRTIERALAHHGVTVDEAGLDARLAHFLAYYGEHIADASRLFPGVAATLEHLAAERRPVACVTNKTEALSRSLLAGIGLGEHFEVVIGGDSLAERKPHPMPLQEACRRLGADPGEALMLGDSITDVDAARAAAIPVVCVRYGYHGEHAPEELGADALVDTLEDLLPPR
jgi:phosphoglycolate phosphatase